MNPRLTSKLDELKGDEISFGEIVDQDPPIMGDPQALVFQGWSERELKYKI
jgi:hypothetical protein